jgi:hypothetical protein
VGVIGKEERTSNRSYNNFPVFPTLARFALRLPLLDCCWGWPAAAPALGFVIE